jgi:hypothetical protein
LIAVKKFRFLRDLGAAANLMRFSPKERPLFNA